MKVSKKVGRRRSSVYRRTLRNKNRRRRYNHAHTHKHGRFHKSGWGNTPVPSPDLHRQNGGIVEVFLMNSKYLGEYELTYSTTKWFSKNATNKFHVYYQILDNAKLYLLRIKDEKYKNFLSVDRRDLEDFISGRLTKLKFKSLDIENGNDTGIIYTFDNSQNNIENFDIILTELIMPPIPRSNNQK